jgi:hypothetical protein
MRLKQSCGGCGAKWDEAKPSDAFKPIPVQAMARRPSPARNLPRRGELVSDRLIRFPGTSWHEIEALPQPLRWQVQRTIFHLLEEPVPTIADSLATPTGP